MFRKSGGAFVKRAFPAAACGVKMTGGYFVVGATEMLSLLVAPSRPTKNAIEEKKPAFSPIKAAIPTRNEHSDLADDVERVPNL
jgi:hypothetical protein